MIGEVQTEERINLLDFVLWKIGLDAWLQTLMPIGEFVHGDLDEIQALPPS